MAPDDNVRHLPPSGRPAVGGGTGGGNYGERLARIEAMMAHLATKEDLQKLRVWVLGGVLAAIVLAAVLAIGVMRLLP